MTIPGEAEQADLSFVSLCCFQSSLFLERTAALHSEEAHVATQG